MQSSTVRNKTLHRLDTLINHEVGRVDRLQRQVSRLQQMVRHQQEQDGKKPCKSIRDADNPFDKILLG